MLPQDRGIETDTAGTETEHETSIGLVIDRHRVPGQRQRVPKVQVRDHRAKPDSTSYGCQSPQPGIGGVP